MAHAALSQFCMQQQVAGITFSFLYYPCVLGKGLNEARVWQLNSNACREAHHTRVLDKQVEGGVVVFLTQTSGFPRAGDHGGTALLCCS